MPVRLALQAVPNQSFTTQLDDQSYAITLKATRGVMSASISINGEEIISNAHIVIDAPLITSPYQEGKGGNFIFTTENDNLPFYTSFDITQFLFYLSAAELSDARSG